MIYVPKLGEDYFKETNQSLSFVNDKLEIQLLSLNISKWKDYVNNYYKNIPTLKEMVLHVPLRYVKIEVIYMDVSLRNKFEDFIGWLNNFVKNDMKIKILFHFSLNKEEMILSSLYDWMNYLFRKINNNKVCFVFENSIGILGYLDGKLFEDVLYLFNKNNVEFCFDICHYNILKNIFYQKFNLNKELFKRCSEVHFSYTKNDGFGKSHGIVHPNLKKCEEDLDLLKDLGIDFSKTWIVAEINEEDYNLRPDEKIELEFLKILSSNY